MLKLIKNILLWAAIILIVGGAMVFVFQYAANRNLFHVLMNNSVVQGSLGVLKSMLIAAAAVLIGFMLLSAAFKLSSYIKRKEEEKRLAELQRKADELALHERMKQQEEQATARMKSAEEAVKQEEENSAV